MNKLTRLIWLVSFAFLFGCATQVPVGVLGEAQEAAVHAKVKDMAAQGKWRDAYTWLEKALSSTDPQEVSRGVAIAAQHPELLRAADSVFQVETLHAFMVQRGRNVGRDLSNIRLQAYRHVATKDGFALAQKNIQTAYDQFAQAEAEKRFASEQEREAVIAGYAKKIGEASTLARFRCRDALECSKAFALTQIYVSENADMKIQTANDTIIETFNPSENRKLGIKAVKFPRSGTTAEIVLSISCPSKSTTQRIDLAALDACVEKMVSVYERFAPFLQRNLQN